jgi:ABC-type glycerol-3-phosphate transport system substrate-binding protein
MKRAALLLLAAATLATGVRAAETNAPPTIQFTGKVVNGDGQAVPEAIAEF